MRSRAVPGLDVWREHLVALEPLLFERGQRVRHVTERTRGFLPGLHKSKLDASPGMGQWLFDRKVQML
jgi:hypothetical protein